MNYFQETKVIQATVKQNKTKQNKQTNKIKPEGMENGEPSFIFNPIFLPYFFIELLWQVLGTFP